MNYLHTSKGRGIASSERLASRGDHLSTDGDGHLCIDDPPAVAITSARTPLRKGPRPRIPSGGGHEAINTKELAARRQATLMVSPAKATTPAPVGDGGLSALGGPRSHLCEGSEDIQEHGHRSRNVRRHVRPPSTTDDAREAVGVADLHTTRPSPMR